MQLPDRFWTKVDKDGPVPEHRPDLGPCWLWTAATVNGYGRFSWRGRCVLAHRLAWAEEEGSLPARHLDHLCRTRNCVNRAHMEEVTNLVNWLRGESPTRENADKTHCPQGHEYTEENTYRDRTGWRECRTCRNEIQRRKRWQRLYGIDPPEQLHTKAFRVFGVPSDSTHLLLKERTG